MYKLISENVTSLGYQASSSVNWTRYFDSMAKAKRAVEEDYNHNKVDEKISWSKTCGQHRAVRYTSGDLCFVMYNISRVDV